MITRKIEISTWDVPFAKIPSDIHDLLSEADILAYESGARYFKDAAKRTGEPALYDALNLLDDNHSMRVYLEKEDNAPWLCWFGFTYVAERRHIRFRPSSNAILQESMPMRLRKVYENFGGINDDRSGDYGLVPPEMIVLASESGWHFIPDILDTACKCWLFYSFGNGDYIGWHEDGRCLMLNHEEECFDELDLDAFLDDYFRYDILALECPQNVS